MLRRSLPLDALICVTLAYIISLGTGYIAERISRLSFESTVAENSPENGEIGGIADASVCRASSISELRSHDTFTIEVDNNDFLTAGTGYLDGMALKVIILPSGERIAATLNYDSIQYLDADELYGGGDVLLPVGRLVAEDLTANEAFLRQIEHSHSLDATDFYVDMAGSAVLYDEDETVSTQKMLVQLITVAVLYPLFHAIGSMLGLWNPYFRRKRTTNWE